MVPLVGRVELDGCMSAHHLAGRSFWKIRSCVANAECRRDAWLRRCCKVEAQAAPWCRITMTIIAALHVPLILLVPWTTGGSPQSRSPPLTQRIPFVMLAILSVVGKLAGSANAPEG